MDIWALPAGAGKRLRTRQRLIGAAYEVFADLGVQATSISAIVEHAGYSRGAFYSSFETKPQLILALYETLSTRQLDIFEEHWADTLAGPTASLPPSLLGTVYEASRRLLATHQADRRWQIVHAELALAAARSSWLKEHFRAVDTRTHDRCASLLTAAAAGAVPSVSAADVARGASDIFAAFASAELRAPRGGRPGAAELAADAIRALVERATSRS